MLRVVVIGILKNEGKRRRSEFMYSRDRASLAGSLKVENRDINLIEF
jgi:hypothetical protein